MKYLVSFLLLSTFAFAELREVEVTRKANNLFDIGDGVVIQTYPCDKSGGKAYYDVEGKQLIFDDKTCDIKKVFGGESTQELEE